jgi:hypothetical protein
VRKDIPNGQRMYKPFQFQGPAKFTHFWDFWYEKVPSGNPGGKHCNAG